MTPSFLVLTVLLLQAAPKAAADPFAAARVSELRTYEAVIETTKGKITLEFLPEKAPETVRQFLRLAAAEVYDNTLVHRVLPNVLIQTGAPYYRTLPLSGRQRRLVHNLAPEFNDTRNVPGIVSMAHDDDPGSGQTSFFICAGRCKEFDGKYTAFARVVAGMPVVRAIAAVPLNGERPKEKIFVIRVTVAKRK
jgi:peptidyl-prolyl cis-trans isomerase B (cyclophilin B)